MNRLFSAAAMLLAAPVAIAQCTLEGVGTQITPTPVDGWSAIQPIGFAFPFAGATYTDVYISDHGLVALSNAGVPAAPASGSFVWNPSTANLVAGGPKIAPYWSDHIAGPGGRILIDNTSAQQCTITWIDHQTYLNQNPPFSLQLTLNLSGRIDIRIDDRANNSGSSFGALNAIVGMSPGAPSVLPLGSDISAGFTTTDNSFFEEFVTAQPATPNPLFDIADKVISCTPQTPTGWNVKTSPLPTITDPPGTQVTPTPVDAWSSLRPIGFAFPFAGSTYTDLAITDHGMVALSNGGTPAIPAGGSFVWNPNTANLVVNGPVIAPYWSDHTPGATGQIWIDNTSGTHCTVTWLNHETFGSTLYPFTVQLTLFSTGTMTMCLEDRVVNSGSTFGALNAITGLSPGTPAVLPPASNIGSGVVTANNTLWEQWTTTAPNTPNPLFDIGNKVLTFTPTNPGWVVTVDDLQCGNRQTYGTGCNGLVVNSNKPIIGQNWNVTTTGIDPLSPIAITFFGAGRVDPGLPLTVIGINAPGCNVHVTGLVGDLSGANIGGTATVTIAIPLAATLKGASLTAQSLGLTTANPAFISTSNGLEGFIGW